MSKIQNFKMYIDDEWVDSVAADTSSYTPADLEQLDREAALQALRRSKTKLV